MLRRRRRRRATPSRTSCCSTSTSSPTGDYVVPRARAGVVSPDERLLGLLGGPRPATRSTSCASATCATGARPAPTWCPRTLLRRRLERRLVVLLLHRARRAYRPHQVWRHRLGTPASDDVLVLEEPDDQFELDGPAHPQRRPRGHLVARAGTPARCGSLDAADPTSRPRSVGGRRRGVEYHAEHVRCADGSDELLLVTNDGATEFRLARCPVPRAADQDHGLAWTRCDPRTRPSGSSGWTRSPGTSCSASRADGRNRLRILPLDDLAGEGVVVAAGSTSRRSVARQRNVEHDLDRIIVVDESYLMPPVWSDARPRHRRAHRAAPQGRRPASTRRRTSASSGRSRRPTARSVPATIVRHRDTPLDGTAPCAALRLRRLRVGLPGPGVGPGHPVAARPRRGLRARPRPRRRRGRPALVARRAAGAQAAHLRRPRRGRRRARARAWSTATGSPPAGSAPAGCSRARCSASGPDRWRAVVAEVPFVDVVTTMLDADHPAHRQRVGRVGRPARPGGLRLDARLLAVRQPAAGRRPARPAGHRRRCTTRG